MSERRWSKFWWQDWARDPALRMCSPAARGIWMDMLCIMADAAKQGHMLVNGRQPTIRQLGSVFGIAEKEAAKLIQELEDAGVFSRSDDGTIISRRMVRDAELSEKGREAIAKRWGTGDDGPKGGGREPNRSPNSKPTLVAKSPPTHEPKSLYSEADAEADSPPLYSPPLPSATASGGRTKRGCRLPPDWQPSAEMRQFAADLGLNPAAITDRFRDFWHASAGANAAKLDWPATWRNWCRREADRLPSRKPSRNAMQNLRDELDLPSLAEIDALAARAANRTLQ